MIKITKLAVLLLFVLFINTELCAQTDEDSKSILRGKQLYEANCQACHMADGNGLAGVFPPLAKSDYLLESAARASQAILNGLNGAIIVNGVTYNGVMSAIPFSNQEVADVMNYIGNTWGNKSAMLSREDISTFNTQ